MTDALCELFGIEDGKEYSKSMENFVILQTPQYLGVDGSMKTSCFKYVGRTKVYFTHKDNLFKPKTDQ